MVEKDKEKEKEIKHRHWIIFSLKSQFFLSLPKEKIEEPQFNAFTKPTNSKELESQIELYKTFKSKYFKSQFCKFYHQDMCNFEAHDCQFCHSLEEFNIDNFRRLVRDYEKLRNTIEFSSILQRNWLNQKNKNFKNLYEYMLTNTNLKYSRIHINTSSKIRSQLRDLISEDKFDKLFEFIMNEFLMKEKIYKEKSIVKSRFVSEDIENKYIPVKELYGFYFPLMGVRRDPENLKKYYRKDYSEIPKDIFNSNIDAKTSVYRKIPNLTFLERYFKNLLIQVIKELLEEYKLSILNSKEEIMYDNKKEVKEDNNKIIDNHNENTKNNSNNPSQNHPVDKKKLKEVKKLKKDEQKKKLRKITKPEEIFPLNTKFIKKLIYVNTEEFIPDIFSSLFEIKKISDNQYITNLSKDSEFCGNLIEIIKIYSEHSEYLKHLEEKSVKNLDWSVLFTIPDLCEEIIRAKVDYLNSKKVRDLEVFYINLDNMMIDSGLKSLADNDLTTINSKEIKHYLKILLLTSSQNVNANLHQGKHIEHFELNEYDEQIKTLDNNSNQSIATKEILLGKTNSKSSSGKNKIHQKLFSEATDGNLLFRNNNSNTFIINLNRFKKLKASEVLSLEQFDRCNLINDSIQQELTQFSMEDNDEEKVKIPYKTSSKMLINEVNKKLESKNQIEYIYFTENNEDFKVLVINDGSTLKEFCSFMSDLKCLGVDLEGDLSFENTDIELIQLYDSELKIIFIFDLYEVKQNKNSSLLDVITLILTFIFESEEVTKIFHDGRGDIIALHNELKICMINAIDISCLFSFNNQLMKFLNFMNDYFTLENQHQHQNSNNKQHHNQYKIEDDKDNDKNKDNDNDNENMHFDKNNNSNINVIQQAHLLYDEKGLIHFNNNIFQFMFKQKEKNLENIFNEYFTNIFNSTNPGLNKVLENFNKEGKINTLKDKFHKIFQDSESRKFLLKRPIEREWVIYSSMDVVYLELTAKSLEKEIFIKLGLLGFGKYFSIENSIKFKYSERKLVENTKLIQTRVNSLKESAAIVEDYISFLNPELIRGLSLILSHDHVKGNCIN